MNDEKQKLYTLIERLISLGEDPDELRYLQSIFGDLTDAEKTQLMQNLECELEALSRVV